MHQMVKENAVLHRPYYRPAKARAKGSECEAKITPSRLTLVFGALILAVCCAPILWLFIVVWRCGNCMQ
jgi:hypothetical protein